MADPAHPDPDQEEHENAGKFPPNLPYIVLVVGSSLHRLARIPHSCYGYLSSMVCKLLLFTEEDATRRTSSNRHQDQPGDSHSQILLFQNLPDDLGLQCLARLPRSSYRSLSRVCKSWRDGFRSQTLYSTRKALGVVDFSLCLQFWIQPPRSDKYRYSNLLEFFPSSSSMVEIPSLPSSVRPRAARFVSLGGRIYLIGGKVGGGDDTLTMWVYDLVSDEWELVPEPQMRVPRHCPAVAADEVSNKIYILGGLRHLEEDCGQHPNWGEVFDPELGTWSSFQGPTMEEEHVRKGFKIESCSVVNGKIMYSVHDSVWVSRWVLDAAGSGEWDELPRKSYTGVRLGGTPVIDGVYYCSNSNGQIEGYVYDVEEWKVLRGLEEVYMRSRNSAGMYAIHTERLVDMNGRLVALWRDEEYTVNGITMVEFHADVLEVRKDDTNAELWGSIIWTGIVAKAPGGTEISACVAVGL